MLQSSIKALQRGTLVCINAIGVYTKQFSTLVMGRTPSWNHPVMQYIRIPVVFADSLRQLAREMDGLATDETLVFTCKMKNTEALQAQDFLEAAEVTLKITYNPDKVATTASQSLEGFAVKRLPAEAWTEAEPQTGTDTDNELDLSTLVNQSFEAASPEAEDKDFDADAVIEQVIEQVIDDTFWLNEMEALEPQKPLENTHDNIDHWHEAIGNVDLSANDAVLNDAVGQPEASALLDLSELSALFAVKANPDTVPDFDPDAVIASVEANAIVETELDADDFDADAVIESALELEPFEAEQTSDQAIAHDAAPTVEAEVEAEAVKPLPAALETVSIAGNEAIADEAELLRPIAIPQIQPQSLTIFADQLFETWQELATQKLKQQKRPQAQPWGVAVELNDLYRTRFTEMLGSHFLKRVQETVLEKTSGQRMRLIAVPGRVNFKIAGVDANAITYEADNYEADNRQSQSPDLHDLRITHTRLESTNASLRTVSPTIKPSALKTSGATASTQTLPSAEPILSEEMARLLRERNHRVSTQGQAQPNWFQRLLKHNL